MKKVDLAQLFILRGVYSPRWRLSVIATVVVIVVLIVILIVLLSIISSRSIAGYAQST